MTDQEQQKRSWNGRGAEARPMPQERRVLSDQEVRQRNRSVMRLVLAVLACLIIPSIIYTALPSVRIILYISLLGIPIALLLDFVFALAPYLAGGFAAAFALHRVFPRMHAVLILSASLVVVGAWRYVETERLNAEILTRAEAAFAVPQPTASADLNLARLALEGASTDCHLTCQRLLVSGEVEEVFLYRERAEPVVEAALSDIAAVAWRLEPGGTCDATRLAFPFRDITDADRDFILHQTARIAEGACFVERTTTLGEATAIIDGVPLMTEELQGSRTDFLQVHDGVAEVVQAVAGGEVSVVLFPAVRINLFTGADFRVERSYPTRQVAYGAPSEARSQWGLLLAVTGIDLRTAGQGAALGDPRDVLLPLVRESVDPENAALLRALRDYAEPFRYRSDAADARDLELVLTALRNPGSPLHGYLHYVVSSGESVPDAVLDDMAAAALARILAETPGASAAQQLFVGLPDHIVSRYRDELFDLAQASWTQQSSVRTLARLADFGEAGAIELAGLLDRIDSVEPAVVNAIYDTVFDTLCDAALPPSPALAERLRHSLANGRLEGFGWSKNGRVIGVLLAQGFPVSEILSLGASHSAFHTDERTLGEVDYINVVGLCRG